MGVANQPAHNFVSMFIIGRDAEQPISNVRRTFLILTLKEQLNKYFETTSNFNAEKAFDFVKMNKRWNLTLCQLYV